MYWDTCSGWTVRSGPAHWTGRAWRSVWLLPERPPPYVTVTAGSGLSQPAGVPHNVVGRSDDLELLEINVPASYGTFDAPAP